MKKIIFLDTTSIGNYHEVFNTTFLAILLKDADQVIYFAENSNIQCIKNLALVENISLENVVFRDINIFLGETSPAIFLRNFLGLFITIKILYKYKTEKIVISQLNPFLGLFFNYFVKKNKVDVSIVCHGELEYIIQKSPIYKPLFY